MFPEKYFLIGDYQSMELLGVKGLFTNLRVDRSSLPEGFYKYSIREGDENPFSSVKENVLVNHMGDFVCKKELDLNGQDECELFDDYCFTDDEVDLDEFFGVDIKEKIAQEIEDYSYTHESYEYKDDFLGCSREDVVQRIKSGLSDKEYVAGLIKHFESVLEENEEKYFLEPALEQRLHSFAFVLTELNSRNRDSLESMVERANKLKEEQANVAQNKTPEIQQ